MRLIVLFLVFLPGAISAQSPDQDCVVNWPPGYEPRKSKFFVHNEIEIGAAPEKVWAILVEAIKWPDWYKGAQDVIISNGDLPFLQHNSVFTWKTMGLNFRSTIKEFEPASRLSWESKKKSIQGYHAWVIIPTATGCRVITDESQNGWLTFFEKTFQCKKLKRLHDVWLKALKKKSEEL
jgi:uncharacterized protein YndB with AHSA1/START domain